MASWIDVFALLATVIIFGAVIYGIIYVVKAVNEGLNSTKESLKSKGLNISSTGVSVKTSHRYTREDQIDATQRHIIRAMGAASFRKGEAPQVPDEQMPQMQRQWSMKSETSTKSSNAEEKEKKKKKLFGSSR